MRKFVGVALVAVIVAVAAWSGLWFYGKGAIAKEVEAQAALIRAQGGQAEYESVEVSGFPFGYTGRIVAPTFAAIQPVLNMPEIGVVENHYSWSAPWIEAKASVTSPDTIEFLMPEEQKASMVTMIDGDEGQAYPISINSKNWRGHTTRAGEGLTGASTAESLTLSMENLQAENGQVVNISVMLSEASGSFEIDDAQADKPQGAFKTLAERMVFQVDGKKPDARAPMSMAFKMENLIGDAVFGETALMSAGSADDIVISLTQPLPVDVAIRRIETRSTAPREGSEKPQPFSSMIDIQDVVLPPIAWMIADPQGVMTRDINQVSLDMSGNAVFSVAPSDRSGMVEKVAGGEMPLELRDIELDALKIDAFGALVEAAGAGVLKDGQPDGRVDVALTGIPALLEALVKTGRVPPEQAVIAQLMLENFAKKEEGSDTLKFGIEAKDGMIFVNGNPIGTAPTVPQ